jgi:LPXTG-motif cell wall-anchored protein
MDRSTPADSPNITTRIKYNTGISKTMQMVIAGVLILGVGLLLFKNFKK